MKKAKIGLFGFGVVGEGIYRVLEEKPSLGAQISKIVIKHPSKDRNAPAHLFSEKPEDILEDSSIDLVVELIDDADAALGIVLQALRSGKSVVSANKKMIAENMPLLIQTARANQVSFLYEAAVCGSVPIIRNLEEYFNNDLIREVTGIVNGSTNFILSQMAKNRWSFEEALREAQVQGFAESDPSLDVEGIDARNKLKIIALHAFGKLIPDEEINVLGIDRLQAFDLEFAKEKGLVIKLIASCRLDENDKITEASVVPTFLPRGHPLRLTDNEFNGIIIGSELASDQFLYGKGAGRYPTSSAVLSDISAVLFDYKYEYRKNIEAVDLLEPANRRFYVSCSSQRPLEIESYGHLLEKYQSQKATYYIIRGRMDSILRLQRRKDISIVAFTD